MGRRRIALAAMAALALLLAALAARDPLAAINAVAPGGASQLHAGLAYGPGARNGIDVYTPLGRHGPLPLLVFFYGGNWVSGSRTDYAFVGRALAARGFVVVIPDYRLYPEVRYPDFLDDAARAVAWTVRHAAQFGADPARLFLMGHSAGAYNAAMLALDARWLTAQGVAPGTLRGWIGLAGPYDFLPVENPTARPVFHFPDTPPASQPILHAGPGAPPSLLIAPNSDALVNPRRNTAGLARKLRGAGVPVRELYFDGVGHASLVASLAAPLQLLAPTLDVVEQFIASDGGRNAK
ncbi:MAG: alpha/beta hydrolase [Pseudomonadota bacterium]